MRVKVLVVPCSLQIGGSEINAVDLAAGVQQRGHDVVVYGLPGPLEDKAAAVGLRVVHAHYPLRLRPSPLAVQDLAALLRREQPDLVHSYESYCSTEAFYATCLYSRTRMVSTIYAMSIDEYLPRSLPVIAGTEALQAAFSLSRPGAPVYRLDPPVDVDANRPDRADGYRFRRVHNIADDEHLVVVVSRLDVWLKLDGLLDAVDAAAQVASDMRIRLLVVGDGPARDALARRAAAVNAVSGREVVTLVGALLDPIPAYRAADVVVGMGTSLLRGMAVGRPCVLVGELGLVRVIRPDTIEPFLVQGFWGVGDGTRGTDRLARALREVLTMAAEESAALGEFGRGLVVDRFGLDVSVDRLLEIYGQAAQWQPDGRQLALDLVRTPLRLVSRKVQDHLPSRRRARRKMLSGTGGNGHSYEAALATPAVFSPSTRD